MIMYDKYNADTLTNLIDTVHRMHNLTSLKERLFVGRVNEWLKQQNLLSRPFQLTLHFSIVPMGPRSENQKIYHRPNTVKRIALSE